MERAISTDRPLQATARVVELGAHHLECVVEVREDEHLICEARIGLCQVREGRAAALGHFYVFDGANGPHPPAPSPSPSDREGGVDSCVRGNDGSQTIVWWIAASAAMTVMGGMGVIGMAVAVERDVPAAMRDGTLLRADVYRPGRG